jgi:hypothetical protein
MLFCLGLNTRLEIGAQSMLFCLGLNTRLEIGADFTL